MADFIENREEAGDPYRNCEGLSKPTGAVIFA